MTLLLGKKPARPGAVKVLFNDTVDVAELPDPGTDFGHERLVNVWDILLNNKIGCCAISGAEHEDMLWTAEAGSMSSFVALDKPPDQQPTVLNYSAVTDYVPGPELTDPYAPENPTDQGTVVADLIKYRYVTGLVDAQGVRHKIDGCVSLTAGDWTDLRYATYYFDGVGLGVRMCQQWMDSFTENGSTVWDYVSNPEWIGGHYITAVAFHNNMVIPITWGEPVQITQAGYEMASDETYAYISKEKIGAKSVDANGFNLDQILANANKLEDVE
jgi:hypothetical protein